ACRPAGALRLMARLDPVFRQMRQQGSTDLHLATGSPPKVRVRGELEALPSAPMGEDEIRAAMDELLSPEQAAEFARFHDVELTYGLPGVARMRGSYFLTQAGPAAIFRLVPETAVPLDSLALPAQFAPLLDRRAGLILCGVPPGSGRSTLAASITDRINGSASRHVTTLEDPVEMLHARRQGVVLQREIGRDTESFASGIRAAM